MNSDEIRRKIERLEAVPVYGNAIAQMQRELSLAVLEVAWQLAKSREEGAKAEHV